MSAAAAYPGDCVMLKIPFPVKKSISKVSHFAAMKREGRGVRSEIHFMPKRGSTSNMCLNRSHLDAETGCLAAGGVQWEPRSPFPVRWPSLPPSLYLPAPNPKLPAWAKLPERGASHVAFRGARPTATALIGAARKGATYSFQELTHTWSRFWSPHRAPRSRISNA